MNLRTYQHNCVESALEQFKTHASTLAVLPTGTGKSIIFSELVRRVYPKRSLVIAHTRELIHQAARHIERAGLPTEIEMGDKKADASMFGNATIIVATVQTLNAGVKSKRMEKLIPSDFGLIVIDEGHRAVCKTYRNVIDHFRKNPDLRIFSCTASPDRLDKQALGKVFDSVAYEYQICEAIEDGWLVPIDQQMVRIKSLDFSKVRTVAGDLNGGDLAEVMEDEKNLQGVVGASIEIVKDKRFIVFTTSVRHAEMCADIFNRHRSGMAGWVCGKTHEDDRDKIIRDYKNGTTQGLVNVGCFVEGFDCPETEVVIMAKPTCSRGRYCQMVGRGTRPLPGIVDELYSSFERREAISESNKASCLVVDFVGNSGKHKLICSADILGGSYDEEVRAMAVADVSESGSSVRMADALKKADKKIRERIEQQKKAEAARKARLIAEVRFSTQNISPFDVFQITPKKDSPYDKGRPLSEKQKEILRKLGVNPDDIGSAAARQLLHKHFERREKGLATVPQCKVLLRAGYSGDEVKKITFVEASKMIDQLKAHDWVRPDLLQLA